MAGKSIRDIQLKGFSAIAAIVAGSSILIGGWLALGQILPSNPRSARNSVPDSQTEPIELPASSTVSSPVPQSALAQNTTPGNKQTQTAGIARQGLLRIGNFSDHPVRVALLLKKNSSAKETVSEPNYEPPAHWDFAPGEGQTKGLVLSLPNRPLKLKAGDILVAFAQDGSRRYWGPYVVGETSAPSWRADSSEWQLSLEP
ncbi:MAG: hypothetical protein NW224_00100 [Leptolyngbyaceae cyanobacterium bins.302]|nr:hypothetical protein [Leptolyngbyaceae cyanobacterium bins.302]